jgi:hypothetical protein
MAKHNADENKILALQPLMASEAPSFKSLDGVDELEQYERLSHLLHIKKAVRDKR